jgi:dTMP kinase
MARRSGFGIERYETSEMQRNVKKMYELMIEHPLWQVIDADKSEDELSAELEEIVEKKIKEIGEQPLELLW